MYCPRCGFQNNEPTKFCRQCGLPLQQISDFVATGGTGSLVQPAPPQPVKAPENSEILALKQKRTLTILSICIAPIITAIAGEWVHLEELAAIPFVLMPIGLTWAVLKFKTRLRQLQERQLSQFYAQQRQYQSIPQQTPEARLVFQPQSNHPQSGDQQPVNAQSPPSQLNAPRTNPLAEPSRGSVIEDETRKFPEQRK